MIYKHYMIVDEKKYLEKVKDIRGLEDIFIILNKRKNVVERVLDNGVDMLNYIVAGKDLNNLKDYLKFSIMEFSDAITNDKCKFRTFNQKYQVFRYTYLQELLNERIKNKKDLNSYLYQFDELKKSEEFQFYFRKSKIERLSEECD